jgi:hypothetical protein
MSLLRVMLYACMKPNLKGVIYLGSSVLGTLLLGYDAGGWL